jgi:hypothetical protein
MAKLNYSAFRTVNKVIRSASVTKGEAKKFSATAREEQRRTELLVVLGAGQWPEKTKKDGTPRKAKSLNAGNVVQVVVRLLQLGATCDDVRTAQPALTTLFPWNIAQSEIRAVAAEHNIPETLPGLFGVATARELEEEEAAKAQPAPAPAAPEVVRKAERADTDRATNEKNRKAHGKRAA